MPRRSSGPRLYLDPKRQQWAIRDGSRFVRTGCGARDSRGAESALARYIGQKHKPKPSNDPLIDEVLTVYGREHAPTCTRAGRDIGVIIGKLLDYWSGKRVVEVTARACRAYPGGRKHLEILSAAIHYWHREYGPLQSVPVVVMPSKGAPRDRWLTRGEAARLLWAARHTEHLKRFIMLGLRTGSRAGVLFALQWEWIDLERGIMRRRATGEAEIKNKRRPPVKLGRRILTFLRRWHAADGGTGPVVHYKGKPATKVRSSWATAIAKANLPGVLPHTMRHTRATWLMQRGVPIWEAAGHLGMTPAILQSVYGHHSPNFQNTAADV